MAPVADAAAGVVVAGDLNAPPGEELHVLLRKEGYFSACVVRLLSSQPGERGGGAV